ncbi:MAG: hypothetical protein L0Y67_04300 [Gammaproteobacteria bacterium]|nr:hypothetical protein [Gammaproteobacteria bacterium]
MVAGDKPEWHAKALAEIASIKQHFIEKYGWQIKVVENTDLITLYMRLQHIRHPERVHMLRLAYGPGFPEERPREGFVNPNDLEQEGLEYWIDDSEGAFKLKHNPAVICLEGTWGFHHVLHRDRDPRHASLNKLLLEIQQCFDRTP